MANSGLASEIARLIAASPLRGWSKDDDGRAKLLPCITFKDFMSCCLYDENYGYYRAGAVRIGRQGDFYTSSAIGHAMANVLAGYARAYQKETGGPISLIEWGAGTGTLSAKIMKAGSSRYSDWHGDVLHAQVEDHPLHQEAARSAWEETVGSAGAKPLLLSSAEAWAHTWPNRPKLIVANELLDAFPVHRVEQSGNELLELGVAVNGQLAFNEVYMPITDSRISDTLTRDGIKLDNGAQTEVNIAAADWLSQLAGMTDNGRAVIIDYGHEAEEYTAQHRKLGTLMCYWKHMHATSPYIRPGEQDITAHVPFTAIMHAAESAGWTIVSYTTQKQFLVDNGILEQLQNRHDPNPFSEAARTNRAVRQLLLSDGMSESFKVLVLEKKWAI